MSRQASECQTGKSTVKPWQLRQHDDEIWRMRSQGQTLQQIADHFHSTKEGIRYALARHVLKVADAKENPEALDGARGTDSLPEGENRATATNSSDKSIADSSPSSAGEGRKVS